MPPPLLRFRCCCCRRSLVLFLHQMLCMIKSQLELFFLFSCKRPVPLFLQ